MLDGTICKVIAGKGFGFISQSGGDDVFFHCNDLADGLEFNEQLTMRRVRFDLQDSPRGPRAANIVPAE